MPNTTESAHPDRPSDSVVSAASETFVWLVISTNGHVMSVLDNEAAAKHVAGDHWIVERWAVRHLVEVEDGLMAAPVDPPVVSAATDEFAFVPEAIEACWRAAWSGDTIAENIEVLENISAAIDWCFNPRDDDASQDSILIDALLNAARFIADQPCTCDPVDPHMDGPCDRCQVLGRLANERQDR